MRIRADLPGLAFECGSSLFSVERQRWGRKITSGTWVMVVPPPVQGATVLHCLARLYGIAIQGATKGATERYTGCYIFHRAWKPRPALRWIIPPKIASNLECKPNALMATIPKDGPLAFGRAVGESVLDWALRLGGIGSRRCRQRHVSGAMVWRPLCRSSHRSNNCV